MLESNQGIKGIKIGDEEVKWTQFVDDTTLILGGLGGSLQAAFNTLQIFGNYSGLKVNTKKTQIVWIWILKLFGINLSVNLETIENSIMAL